MKWVVSDEDNLSDRRLGHEWHGWDGNIETHEAFIREPKRLFLGIVFFAFAIVLGVACLLAWAIYPRLQMFHPILGHAMLLVLLVGSMVFAAVYTVLCSALLSRQPMRLAEWTTDRLFKLFPILTLLANRLGVSKDRLGNSLIGIHNEVTRARLRKVSSGRILCLAPRCLTRQNMDQVKAMTSEYDCDFFVAATGALARQRVKQLKPVAIIGIACERDLITGIRDAGYKIPVIGIANKRPHGPCKGAYIDLGELRAAIDVLKNQFDFPEKSPTNQPEA